MKGVTLYLCVSDAGGVHGSVERMALHPVLDDQPTPEPPDIDPDDVFPCRVVYRLHYDDEDVCWAYSCMGADTVHPNNICEHDDDSFMAGHPIGDVDAAEDNTLEAFEWLLAGEPS